MNNEIKTIKDNNTWELVDLPNKERAIETKQVYKIKYDNEGNVSSYKARFVAKGYRQKLNYEFENTYSLVCKHETIRLLFAIAAHDFFSPQLSLFVIRAFQHPFLSGQKIYSLNRKIR